MTSLPVSRARPTDSLRRRERSRAGRGYRCSGTSVFGETESAPFRRAPGELMTAWPKGAPQVGDRAELSRTISTADIERFTDISGDRNPLHYDESAARASRFGEI